MEPNKRKYEEKIEKVRMLKPRPMSELRFRRNNQYIDAYSRHKILINQYVLTHKGSSNSLKRDTSKDVRDIDILRKYHQFIWNDMDEGDTWEKRMAKKYYDKLFKEYCLADLIQYKNNKIAMRWRTKREVIDGKGQFICGSLHCDQRSNLTSWQVNFGYIENNTKKNALVKLRLCCECSIKLNYNHQRKQVSKIKKNQKTADDLTPMSISSADQVAESPKAQTPTNLEDIWSTKVEHKDNEQSIEAELDDFLSEILL